MELKRILDERHPSHSFNDDLFYQLTEQIRK